MIQQPLKPGKKFLQMLIGLLTGDGLDLGENRVLGIKEGGLSVLNRLIEFFQQLGVERVWFSRLSARFPSKDV
mgnify:CR=1 FL=1